MRSLSLSTWFLTTDSTAQSKGAHWCWIDEKRLVITSQRTALQSIWLWALMSVVRMGKVIALISLTGKFFQKVLSVSEWDKIFSGKKYVDRLLSRNLSWRLQLWISVNRAGVSNLKVRYPEQGDQWGSFWRQDRCLGPFLIPFLKQACKEGDLNYINWYAVPFVFKYCSRSING